MYTNFGVNAEHKAREKRRYSTILREFYAREDERYQRINAAFDSRAEAILKTFYAREDEMNRQREAALEAALDPRVRNSEAILRAVDTRTR